MHRIGHQHIGMNITGLARGRVGEAFEVGVDSPRPQRTSAAGYCPAE